MRLHKILSGAGFACGLIGMAGLAGTIENVPTDWQGIWLSLGLLVAAVLLVAWGAWEEGIWQRRRSERRYHR